MSVRIDCTVPKLMPTSLDMLRRSHLLSHVTRVCTALTLLSTVASLGRPDLQSSSMLSLPLLNSTAKLFHCAIRRRLLPNGFHEVFNILGRRSFLTEVLDNGSDFKFLHFANVSQPPLLKVLYISNKSWPHVFHTPNVLQLDQLTDWQRF